MVKLNSRQNSESQYVGIISTMPTSNPLNQTLPDRDSQLEVVKTTKLPRSISQQTKSIDNNGVSFEIFLQNKKCKGCEELTQKIQEYKSENLKQKQEINMLQKQLKNIKNYRDQIQDQMLEIQNCNVNLQQDLYNYYNGNHSESIFLQEFNHTKQQQQQVQTNNEENQQLVLKLNDLTEIKQKEIPINQEINFDFQQQDFQSSLTKEISNKVNDNNSESQQLKISDFEDKIKKSQSNIYPQQQQSNDTSQNTIQKQKNHSDFYQPSILTDKKPPLKQKISKSIDYTTNSTKNFKENSLVSLILHNQEMLLDLQSYKDYMYQLKDEVNNKEKCKQSMAKESKLFDITVIQSIIDNLNKVINLKSRRISTLNEDLKYQNFDNNELKTKIDSLNDCILQLELNYNQQDQKQVKEIKQLSEQLEQQNQNNSDLQKNNNQLKQKLNDIQQQQILINQNNTTEMQQLQEQIQTKQQQIIEIESNNNALQDRLKGTKEIQNIPLIKVNLEQTTAQLKERLNSYLKYIALLEDQGKIEINDNQQLKQQLLDTIQKQDGFLNQIGDLLVEAQQLNKQLEPYDQNHNENNNNFIEQQIKNKSYQSEQQQQNNEKSEKIKRKQNDHEQKFKEVQDHNSIKLIKIDQNKDNISQYNQNNQLQEQKNEIVLLKSHIVQLSELLQEQNNYFKDQIEQILHSKDSSHQKQQINDLICHKCLNNSDNNILITDQSKKNWPILQDKFTDQKNNFIQHQEVQNSIQENTNLKSKLQEHQKQIHNEHAIFQNSSILQTNQQYLEQYVNILQSDNLRLFETLDGKIDELNQCYQRISDNQILNNEITNLNQQLNHYQNLFLNEQKSNNELHNQIQSLTAQNLTYQELHQRSKSAHITKHQLIKSNQIISQKQIYNSSHQKCFTNITPLKAQKQQYQQYVSTHKKSFKQENTKKVQNFDYSNSSINSNIQSPYISKISQIEQTPIKQEEYEKYVKKIQENEHKQYQNLVKNNLLKQQNEIQRLQSSLQSQDVKIIKIQDLQHQNQNLQTEYNLIEQELRESIDEKIKMRHQIQDLEQNLTNYRSDIQNYQFQILHIEKQKEKNLEKLQSMAQKNYKDTECEFHLIQIQQLKEKIQSLLSINQFNEKNDIKFKVDIQEYQLSLDNTKREYYKSQKIMTQLRNEVNSLRQKQH